LNKIVESANVRVDEDIEKPSRSCGYDPNEQNDSSNKEEQARIQDQVQIILLDPVNQEKEENEYEEEIIQESEVQENTKTPRYIKLNHFEDNIIGDKMKCVQTRRIIAKEYCLISKIEPKNVDEACKDEH
jgi:hypothetical protein